MLAAEMEAATLNIANLALVDAQSQNLVSSDMVVFRRLAEKNLKFQQMAIEAQSSKEENETTHRRVQTNFQIQARHASNGHFFSYRLGSQKSRGNQWCIYYSTHG
ncbi:hypothetical protein JG688_00002408 [Phytophthora aleatoria]|uniref:Uncharacterized protein n=1 Tax=Phytophthora aleatoria TaxID=2496075 RepID=A0A8J5J5P4_9STRA|nr:hypothetical protein JG688_00002408 [Phytophthora aleatoria]